MKKVLFLSLLFILFFTTAQAQPTVSSANSAPPSTNSDVITALKVKGKVKYAKPGKKKYKKVKAGAILDKKGSVKLKKKAKITLTANGKTGKLKSKGKHSLADLSMTEGGDDDNFLSFLTSASGFGGPGGGSARDTTKKKNSGAGSGDALVPSTPLGGKIPANTVSFSWTGKNANGFSVNLYDSDEISAQAIFSKKSTGNTLMLDVKTIEGIEMDKSYYWEIQKNGTEEFSPKIKISFTDASAANNVLNKLIETDAYKNAADWEKALRSAHVLQENNLLHDAYKVYQKAMKDFPKNDLIYSSFVQMESNALNSN